jgi:serine/threonine protein phosphatase PrpC
MAKIEACGGNPNVVIATPEITSFRLSKANHDFLMIACDGVFDVMSTQEAVNAVW